MVNASKRKGDEGEREAVVLLKERMPDLANPKAKRELGAGRLEDIGDVTRVLPQAVIQVKKPKASRLGDDIRAAAKGATRQFENALAEGYSMRFCTGMVPIPNASKSGAVRWLAACETWPLALADLPLAEPVRFSAVAPMIAWLKDDAGPYGYRAWPRETRIATFGKSADDSVLVAPIEAWLEAYRSALALSRVA